MEVITGGAQRRPTGLVPVLLLLGLVLALVGTAIFVGSQPRDPSLSVVPSAEPSATTATARPSPSTAPSASPLADTAIALPFTALQLFAGDDAMWVAVGGPETKELPRSVYRIDVATNTATRVISELPIGPTERIFFVQTAGSIWASAEPDRELRFDAVSGQVIGQTTLGKMAIDPYLAFGDVWHPNYGEGSITRVDAATGDVVKTIPVPQFDGQGPLAIAEGTTLVWALAPRAGKVVGIDPSTNRIVKELPLGGELRCGISVAGGRLWIGGCPGQKLEVYDETSLAIVKTIDFGVDVGTPLTVAAGRAWVSGLDTVGVRETDLMGVDLQTYELGPEVNLGVETGPVVAFGAIWYSSGTNVYRLSGDVLATS
jgi:outer membrane protein assembly factor BamB